MISERYVVSEKQNKHYIYSAELGRQERFLLYL